MATFNWSDSAPELIVGKVNDKKIKRNNLYFDMEKVLVQPIDIRINYKPGYTYG
ncbi:MAG: hypothetical protein WA395_11820 [Nitrososphaeraceae archaeon]|jgi:hypothetical protein